MSDAFIPVWEPADVDAKRLWADSGGQWLTVQGASVPVELIRQVAGITAYLDGHGAGLARLFRAEGVGVLAERAAILALPPSGRVSSGGATHLIRASDGWIALSLPRPDDESLIPAWLETGETSTGLWPAVDSAVSVRSTERLVGRASLLGLPCSALGETPPSSAAVLTESVGEATSRSIVGSIVVNLAALWAGPLCANVLSRLGARVINVESTGRPDGSRDTPRFFEALHAGQESVALDFTTDDGRHLLRQLLAVADVVIEGSRPRALSQLGIDAAELVGIGPRLWISITAHGRSGPHANRVGFGDDCAVAGGLIASTDDGPAFLADAIADPITGLIAAAVAVDLVGRGGRYLVDVALSRVAASMSGAGGGDPVRPDHGAAFPETRAQSGAPLPFGRDTTRVLAELLH